MTFINTFNSELSSHAKGDGWVVHLCRKQSKNETEYKLLFMTIYENIKQLESVEQLHSNTLVNADCLEAMKYIADKSIDCIIADLPYG